MQTSQNSDSSDAIEFPIEQSETAQSSTPTNQIKSVRRMTFKFFSQLNAIPKKSSSCQLKIEHQLQRPPIIALGSRRQSQGITLKNNKEKILQRIKGSNDSISGGTFTIVSGEKVSMRVENSKSIVTFKDGSVFEGTVKQGEMKKGIIKFANGESYEGAFKERKFHGRGIYRCKNGKIFDCCWMKGEMMQQGIIKYPNGEVYSGGISAYKKDGFGQIIFPTGFRYVGQFSKGQINGRGEYFKGKQLIAKGQWINGLLVSNQFDPDNIISKNNTI